MRWNGSPNLCRGQLKSERGTTLVEFALVATMLLVTMLGIVDFSRALYTYHYLSNMARTATRWAAVNGYTCADDTSTTDTGGSCDGTGGMNNGPASASDIAAYVSAHAPDGINTNDLTTTATWPVVSDGPTICGTAVTGYASSPYPNYPGCTVKVKLSYQFNFLYPFIPTSSLTLSSTSEMIISH